MPTIDASVVKRLAAILRSSAAFWPASGATTGDHGAADSPLQIKAGISDPVNTVLAWYMARDAGLYARRGSTSTSST